MSEPRAAITEFTDPACPWAYSAEPFRHRLDWLYDGSLEWEPRMVVLADSPADHERNGFTPEKLAAALEQIGSEREELGRVATQTHVGADGFWELEGSG